MPGIRYYQTDGEALQIPDFSYGGFPVLPRTVTSYLSKDVNDSGGASHVINTPADTNEYTAIIMTTRPGTLLATNWRSGDWQFTMRIASGDANLVWEKMIIHRIRSAQDALGAGTSVESITIDVGLTMNSGNLVHQEFNVAAFIELAREDMLCLVMTVKNVAATSSSVTIQLNQIVETALAKRWRASQIVGALPLGTSLPQTFYGPPVDVDHCLTPMTKSYASIPLESGNVIIEAYIEQAAKAGDVGDDKIFPLDSATWTKVNVTSTATGDGTVRTMEFLPSDITQDFIRPVIEVTFNNLIVDAEIVGELWIDQMWYVQEDPLFGKADANVTPTSNQLTDDFFTQAAVFKDLTA